MIRSELSRSDVFSWNGLSWKLLCALGAVGLLVALPSGVAQYAGAQNAVGRPLDLPNGKVGKDEEDEENEPETIVFYGSEYEADAFFWCLDRSCSMSSGSPPLISVLKQEVTAAINSLSSDAEIGLVNYESDTSVWNPQPQKANPSNKGSAIAWVQAMVVDGLTCLADAGVQTVQISNLSRKRHRTIIVVSDGVPNCPACAESVAAITTANWKRTPINTLFLGANTTGSSCMQSLAAANNGTFQQVQ